MGFGDFMSGMQGGMSTMDDLKNARQRRKLYDQVLTEGDYELAGKERARARAGLDPIARSEGSDTFIGKLSDKLDPVIARWMEKLGRGTGATESPVASALPTSGEMAPLTSLSEGVAIPELDPSQLAAPDYEFADGGDVEDALRRADELSLEEDAGPKQRRGYNADSPEEISKRASRARAGSPPPREAVPTQVIDRSADKTLGQKVAGAAKEHAKYKGVGLNLQAPEGAGLLRRGATGVARVAGRGLAAAGIAGAAAGGIRGALDTETTGDGFWSDVGQRAKGAAKGAVSGFLDPLGAITGSDPEAPQPEAPAEAIPTSSGPTNPRRYPGQGAARRAAPPAAAPATAVPTEAPEADPLAGFDVTKIPAEKIPNFSNQDWISFREEAIKDYVSSGMSYAEAWDKVDQQVVATQQRGFMHFGNQARALLANGDINGAASAVRAAFQYLPSTTDLQVGEYNGHLVAFGVDEDTGEQVGQPIVITPEFLDSALMNFSDRKAWSEHAQDNRRLDQADTELEQGSRRLDLMEQGLGIERENALTKRLDAIGGGLGGGGGLKETDIATARKYLNDWAYGFAKGQDPAIPAALTALAEAQYTRRGGELSTIVMRLEEMMRSPGGPETILAAARRLASGQ